MTETRFAPDLVEGDDWATIHSPDRSCVALPREANVSPGSIQDMISTAPFQHLTEGHPDELPELLAGIPVDLKEDICGLAKRFAETMSVRSVRVKLKGVTTNACHKLHSDFTDVRLIGTYAGPGTLYVPDGGDTADLMEMPTGWVGLFKGRAYGDDHPACRHRSPAIAETGKRRLLLVIDTPAFGSQVVDLAYPDPSAEVNHAERSAD